MILRQLEQAARELLDQFPVVALVGPRQVGKTTLALEITSHATKPTLHLDLERESDLARLADAEAFLARRQGVLVVLDEIHRRPDLFPLLRALVDERIRAGESAGHFLVLGSAAPDLLRQSSETLAGRIASLELSPFSLAELTPVDGETALDRLWVRGGFPDSYLASDPTASLMWREQFIRAYLERDLPQLGPRLPAERTRHLWTMLAHGQGDLLNASRLAAGLGLSSKTVRHYVDALTDLFLVRQLPPWMGHSRKRLVRSPKIYVRDSGLAHALARIPDLDTLLGHPLCGSSWEGFVIEQILPHVSSSWDACFYRTSAQAEIDLVLVGPAGRTVAIEIKRSTAPRVSRGFWSGCEDIGATERYVVMPRGDAFVMGNGLEAVSVLELVARLMG